MDPRIGVIAVGATPQRIAKAEDLLRGEMAEDRLFDEAASQVSKEIEPESDLHASAEYRRHVAGVLTRRALRLASERARTFV
jgi:CO/xanthine dehydrogenase FAD-binding subunit